MRLTDNARTVAVILIALAIVIAIAVNVSDYWKAHPTARQVEKMKRDELLKQQREQKVEKFRDELAKSLKQ